MVGSYLLLHRKEAAIWNADHIPLVSAVLVKAALEAEGVCFFLFDEDIKVSTGTNTKTIALYFNET